MRGPHKLHAAFGDGPRRDSLQLGTDLVDDDALRHVVLHSLDHHRVLQRRSADLHAPGTSDPGMRDVTVARDLVGRVDDDHALTALVAEHARAFAQHRCLADARGPSRRIDWPLMTMSLMMSIVPVTARPTRQVRPTMAPLRLRMALIRWSVRRSPLGCRHQRDRRAR